MPEYIDTHAHLYLDEFSPDRSEVVERARAAGVNHIFLPNIDRLSIHSMNSMVAEYPGICHAMIGLHPTSVKDNFREELDVIEKEMKTGKYRGIGEIGIDLYWDKTFFEQQQQVFTAQLELSLQYNLPVVIHARESFDEILDIIKGYNHLKGIFHAFSGTTEIARQVVDMGFLLGVGGMITYKKSDLPAVVRDTAIEHLVLETDSPYLAPVPYRGKRNESSHIPVIAQVIHQIKNLPLEEVARITTANAAGLFGITPNTALPNTKY